MIEVNEIFSDSDKRVALWCDDASDTTDLAVLADSIIQNNIDLISVPPEIVSFLWTCLEKKNVKIFARYVFDTATRNIEDDISELVKKIIETYKSGANGAQIFLNMRNFEKFMDMLFVVKDDLFFGHDLCVAMDICNIGIDDWDMVFNKLRDVNAAAFGIVLGEDMGNRSDYIGRIYGMLEKWNFDGDLHFMLKNNFDRIDQSIRLVEKMRPELSDKLHFFLEY